MGTILYKRPIISAIAIDLMTVIMFIYFINHSLTVLFITLAIPALAIVKIANNGNNLNTKSKTIIFFSFIISIGVVLSYFAYTFQIRLEALIN